MIIKKVLGTLEEIDTDKRIVKLNQPGQHGGIIYTYTYNDGVKVDDLEKSLGKATILTLRDAVVAKVE